MKTVIAVSRYIEFYEPKQTFRSKVLYKNIDGEDTFYNTGYRFHNTVEETRRYIDDMLGSKTEEGFPVTVLFEDAE